MRQKADGLFYRRADLRRGHCRAGAPAAPRKSPRGRAADAAGAGGDRRGLVRLGLAGEGRRSGGGEARERLLRRAVSGRDGGALLRDENGREARAVRAGVGEHGQGREGCVHGDDAHEHEPGTAASADAVAAAGAEASGKQKRDGHDDLLSRRRMQAGARRADAQAAGHDPAGGCALSGGGGGDGERVAHDGVPAAPIHGADGQVLSGTAFRADRAAGGRTAGRLSDAGEHRAADAVAGGPGGRSGLGDLRAGAAVSGAAGKPAAAGALRGDGHAPSGDAADKAADVDHREQEGRAVFYNIRGAWAAGRV